jgi:hypothetical protein
VDSSPIARASYWPGGRSLDGTVLNEGSEDAQVRADDNRIHLLRSAGPGRFREVTSEINWNTYNGDIGGNRYTALKQIDRTNVKRVAPKWIFRIPNAGRLQGTPVVADWRDVRHAGQRVLCARRRQRPRDLAIPASAIFRPRRRRGEPASIAVWR